MWLNISEILISWLLISVFLFLTGRIISKSRIRLIDVFGTQALAKSPIFFTSLLALFLPGAGRFSQELMHALMTKPPTMPGFSFDMATFFILTLFAILMIIWMVILMYRAFAVSCNVAGGSAVSLFIVAMVIVEFLSVSAIHSGLGNLVAKPTHHSTREFVPGDFSLRATEFVTLLSSGDFGAAVEMFDATMTSKMSAEKLEETWQALVAQAGSFKGQAAPQKKEVPGYDVYLIPCRFEKASLNTQVAFDLQGEIAGLFFLPADGN